MPIDYTKYPPIWKTEIRPAVLKRANNCCEECGVQNYAYGYRDNEGKFHQVHDWYADQSAVTPQGQKIIRIILTVAHLDHDPENWNVKLDRLKALCQLHHLRYDVEMKRGKTAIKNLVKSEINRSGDKSGLSFAKTQFDYNGKYE